MHSPLSIALISLFGGTTLSVIARQLRLHSQDKMSHQQVMRFMDLSQHHFDQTRQPVLDKITAYQRVQRPTYVLPRQLVANELSAESNAQGP